MPPTKSTSAKKSDGSEKSRQKYKPKHTSKNKRNHLIPILISVIGVFIIAFGICMAYVNGYDRVYPNTYIGDKDVSGITEGELSDYINSTYKEDKIKGSSVAISCKTQKMDLGIDSLSVKFKNDTLKENVLKSGKSGNLFKDTFTFICRLFSKKTADPVIEYKNDVLLSAFDKVTSGFEYEPVGYTFTIGDNKVTINGTVNGMKADRELATSNVESQIKQMSFSSVELTPVSVIPPPVDFEEFYKWLTSDAEDARYEKKDGKIQVIPSKSKCEVDRKVVEKALNDVKQTTSNIIEIDAITTKPKVLTEDLTSTLYKDKLSSYTTSFGGSSAARANNVRTAASRINGIELMPDKEFSYDKTILPRKAENGYMAAPVYVGNKVESGMGGGICQPSSTLYVAALYANLQILERHNHSMAVGYLPAGLDATVSEGYLDMRFKNTTGYPIKILASADGGVLTFSIYGYNPENTSVEILRSGSDMNFYVTRVVKKDGKEIAREQMSSSHYVPHEEEKKPEEKKPEEKKPEEKPNTQEATKPASTPAKESETPANEQSTKPIE